LLLAFRIKQAPEKVAQPGHGATSVQNLESVAALQKNIHMPYNDGRVCTLERLTQNDAASGIAKLYLLYLAVQQCSKL
jgi:hypothetical protein